MYPGASAKTKRNSKLGGNQIVVHRLPEKHGCLDDERKAEKVVRQIIPEKEEKKEIIAHPI